MALELAALVLEVQGMTTPVGLRRRLRSHSWAGELRTVPGGCLLNSRSKGRISFFRLLTLSRKVASSTGLGYSAVVLYMVESYNNKNIL